MTKHAKYNLLGMLLLPMAAVVAAGIATLNGVFNAYGATYGFLFALNLVVTLPAALFSWLFLRRSQGEVSRWVAITPCLFPAIYGACWYLWRAVSPADVAAGAEYIGAQQYLVIVMLAMTFLVLFVRVTRILPRTA